MYNTSKKASGFEGELIIQIPQIAIRQSKKMPLIHTLFISKIGFYPKAVNHYYKRPNGISEVILLYCTDGKGWLQFRKKKVWMQAGSVYLIPASVQHSYGADVNNPWTIYWLHISGSRSTEAVKAIMGSNEKKDAAVQINFSTKRNDIFEQMTATLLKGYSYANLLFANMLLNYYLCSFMVPEPFQEKTLVPAADSPMDKAIQFMQQNLARTITLNEIARSAHLSVSFFSRKFRQYTGYAPIAYFNFLRIQQACQLLHFSNLRINEVASEIGIDDPFYFSRLFRQQIGVSPVAYRKGEGSVAIH